MGSSFQGSRVYGLATATRLPDKSALGRSATSRSSQKIGIELDEAINNFSRHPRHEVVVVTVNFGLKGPRSIVHVGPGYVSAFSATKLLARQGDSDYEQREPSTHSISPHLWSWRVFWKFVDDRSMRAIRAGTVHLWTEFGPFGLPLNEEQIPQIVENNKNQDVR